MLTADEYVESLQARRPLTVYLEGEKLEDPLSHPYVKASVNAVALTYALAEKPEHQALMTATSKLTGKPINRFCNIHQSAQDLVSKVKMQRLLGQHCGTCFQRCVGMDALNAIWATTYDIDQAKGTAYHQRFQAYVAKAEANDWTIDGCMTDVKGDRNKRPGEQADLDMYVRVVDRRPDGVVIRGAKAHQTGAINSHEMLIMPTAALQPGEEDFAICCSLPADEPGITYIYGRQSCDSRKLDTSLAGDIDAGNACYGGQECLVIFDDVFVPTQRIYMDGEVAFAGALVERFASYHRQSYGGCKTGVGDVLIGATATIADLNGVQKASAVKDKLVEMNHLNETMYACGLACSANGKATPAGNYMVDTLLANVCKQNVTRMPYEMARLAQDVAGGLVVTLPSARDFLNPDTRELLEKYYRGAEGSSTWERIRMLRFIENLTLGRGAVGYLAESMHGAGSPQAQRIMIARQANVDLKKIFAKALAFNSNLPDVEAAIEEGQAALAQGKKPAAPTSGEETPARVPDMPHWTPPPLARHDDDPTQAGHPCHCDHAGGQGHGACRSQGKLQEAPSLQLV
jgi:4-hydroxybutyryl-CoA dehydratase/vinylacetyl-CoA-Delta-isomerase